LLASTTTHTLVDVLWTVWFRWWKPTFRHRPGGQEPQQGQQSHGVVIGFTAQRSNRRKNSYWRFPNQQSATPMVVRGGGGL